MAESADPTDGAQAAGTDGVPGAGTPAASAASTPDLAALQREAAQARASQQRADQLAARLAKYEAAERDAQLAAAGDQGRLQVELEMERKARQEAEQRAKSAELTAAYPLAMKRLGAEALKLSDEAIAGLNADLAAAAAGAEPPTPLGSNPAKGAGAATAAKPKTSDDLKAELEAQIRAQGNPWATN